MADLRQRLVCFEPGHLGSGGFAWTGVGSRCEDCHRGPHGDQFDLAEQGADCRRCHATTAWTALLFQHDRDATFRLGGAHARTACAACHKPEPAEDRLLVRYRPLPLDCKGCHGITPPETRRSSRR